jgi:hypothetical protein
MRFDVTTRTPTDVAAKRTMLAPGVWYRANLLRSVTITTSSHYEVGFRAWTSGDAFTVEVWTDSLMLENASTPWTGLHPTQTVSSTPAVGDRAYAYEAVPLTVLWGDSIPAAGGTAVSNHLIAEMICGYFESPIDSDTLGGVGGETSAQVLSRATTAIGSDATLADRATIIWCGTNDSILSPADSLDNLLSLIELLLAAGNTRYAVATVLLDSDASATSAQTRRINELNELIRSHPWTRHSCIDISPHWAENARAKHRGDVTHPNNLGISEIIWPYFRDRLIELGWYERRETGHW